MKRHITYIITAYTVFWTHAFDFKGFTKRKDYWLIALCNFTISLFLILIFEIFYGVGLGIVSSTSMKILSIYSLIGIIPSFSLAVRRIHDAGKGWQWIFISLIPFIGPLWFLYIMLMPSVSNARLYTKK